MSEKEEKEESKQDYASRRMVELKNSEQQFIDNLNRADANLEKAKADLIACRARINEITQMIQPKPAETSNEPAEKS